MMMMMMVVMMVMMMMGCSVHLRSAVVRLPLNGSAVLSFFPFFSFFAWTEYYLSNNNLCSPNPTAR